METKNFSLFEKKIGIVFKNKDLLKQAFTHRSFTNEREGKGMQHNERLEFLGDAVLELVTTEELYKRYPESNEGQLTVYRTSLVNSVMLAKVAKELGMEDYLILSKGEEKDTGRARSLILARALEALLGAIFLDRKYNQCKKFINKYIVIFIDEIIEKKLWIDPKSLIQEEAQKHLSVTPSYKTIVESGPDHDVLFSVGVYFNYDLVAIGEGKSKQEAEVEAAREALKIKGWA